MQLYSLKLVTIVAEEILKDQISKKIKDSGATGFTCSPADGYGSRGTRKKASEDNVMFEVICPDKIAFSILKTISDNFFENYACIAWVTEVSVVRGTHYVKS